MTDEELLSRATQFDLGPDPSVEVLSPMTAIYFRINLCSRSKLVGKKKNKTSRKWVITNSQGYTLNKKRVWEYEPIPSERTEAYESRTRFKTIQAALKVFDAWKGMMEVINENLDGSVV